MPGFTDKSDPARPADAREVCARPADSDVLAQLDRILADPVFVGSRQLSAFLRFVVGLTLAGRCDEIKEYVIGVDVLKRGAAYNPREDPSVRVVAGRVRAKLAEYYQGPGRNDRVLIGLPKGGYVPEFE